MEESIGNKRSREESPENSPEAKRLHADLLFGVLEEDDIDAGDLATVMKSLEEEIAMPVEEKGEGGQVEIGYLLEASDDDLGLPPPPEPIEEEEGEAAEGFGRIWGFEEEEMPVWYEGLSEFGFPVEERFCAAEDGGDGGSFDGGLFDSSDFYWRTESMLAQ